METEAPHDFLARRIQRSGDAAAAIRGVDADVGAVKPLALRLMRRQPAALDDVGEGVIDVVEIEMQAQRRRRADDAVAVERDELAVGEQVDVVAIMRRLETFLIVERWKADALELFELGGVLRPRLHDDEIVRKPPVVPHRSCSDL